MPEDKSIGQTIRNIKTLEALVLRACTNCGAPGVYRPNDDIREKWSGCWVPSGDPREGQPVGEVCPHCNTPRLNGPDLGVIWHN